MPKLPRYTRPLVLCILLCCSFPAVTAREPLPDSLARERISVIQEMLDQGRKGANRWWKGWLIGYSAATVAQTAIAVTGDDLKTHQDWTLGAVSTLLGAAGQLISPLTPGYTSDRLREMPENTAEDLAIKLAEAEKQLEACALREKSGRSWKTHALDGAVNVGFGIVIWYGFKRSFMEGFTNIALNTAVCEAQIFSQPTRAIRNYNRYCQQYHNESVLVEVPPAVSWHFTLSPGGLGVRIVF